MQVSPSHTTNGTFRKTQSSNVPLASKEVPLVSGHIHPTNDNGLLRSSFAREVADHPASNSVRSIRVAFRLLLLAPPCFSRRDNSLVCTSRKRSNDLRGPAKSAFTRGFQPTYVWISPDSILSSNRVGLRPRCLARHLIANMYAVTVFVL